jgi:hypothetical protein
MHHGGYLIYFFYNNKMANIFRPTYDPGRDSGTSGAEVSDLRPEQAYDTDMRRLSEDDRGSAASVNRKQDRVARFMKAARSAGEYQKRALVREPTSATLGDSGGRAGAVGYARKPVEQFGKPFG